MRAPASYRRHRRQFHLSCSSQCCTIHRSNLISYFVCAWCRFRRLPHVFVRHGALVLWTGVAQSNTYSGSCLVCVFLGLCPCLSLPCLCFHLRTYISRCRPLKVGVGSNALWNHCFDNTKVLTKSKGLARHRVLRNASETCSGTCFMICGTFTRSLSVSIALVLLWVLNFQRHNVSSRLHQVRMQMSPSTNAATPALVWSHTVSIVWFVDTKLQYNCPCQHLFLPV